MQHEIVRVTSDLHYREFGEALRDYVEWCRVRYGQDRWFVETAFSLQSFEAELADPRPIYGPPNGCALLAVSQGRTVGCIAYRRLSDGICEMKRLFVRSDDHGRGTGRRLCNALIERARADGYSAMRLDTEGHLHEAIALYRSLGFRDCAPYNTYPDRMMPRMVFMELPLAQQA